MGSKVDISKINEMVNKIQTETELIKVTQSDIQKELKRVTEGLVKDFKQYIDEKFEQLRSDFDIRYVKNNTKLTNPSEPTIVIPNPPTKHPPIINPPQQIPPIPKPSPPLPFNPPIPLPIRPNELPKPPQSSEDKEKEKEKPLINSNLDNLRKDMLKQLQELKKIMKG